MLRFLTRLQIDDDAWNLCVSTASNPLIYGHTWYLDAVTDLADWKWEGLVLSDETGQYVAVLTVPLRRRWGFWVVYQPFFCQFLALFSAQPIDVVPFLEAVVKRYWYASKWHLLLNQPLVALPRQVRCQIMHTHVLPLADDSRVGYTADRNMNLRRATRRIDNVPDWRVENSTDIEPLIRLFRENHAGEIGVAEWSYGLFRSLFSSLQQRGLGTLRYAWADGQIVAGGLFVEQHQRVIYLFNAANAAGRRLNARSLLIDELIQTYPKKATPEPTLLDFESPEKQSVVAFYESFGAQPQAYSVLSWNRLWGANKSTV
ncbi:GNAT family N-acetyltransferase [Fibrella aquatica]|uniref:GNAT family N-acetyltransferase n=1 Tax=Fibrella aquatica TaxID=3242487 RepID=UPI00351FE3D9